jgi:tetratricopeptide (TPR) repeat protein
MIETGLVYIHSVKPTRRFVGCGALVEGGYVATCRHVWRMATESAAKLQDGEPLEVEVEYPFSRDQGATVRSAARLIDECEGEDGLRPDLALLLPTKIPDRLMTLQLAAENQFEVGEGFVHAGLAGRDTSNPQRVADEYIHGQIAKHKNADGMRQFTGVNAQSYWTERGSSGSPLFIEGGQQLAGILSLSELGANQGQSPLHEAFIVPGTTIRSFLSKLAAKHVATRTGSDLAELQPVLDSLAAQGVPVSEIPNLLKQFVDTVRARAQQPVRASNDGADIEAVIGASRTKLRTLDTAGAIEMLQNKINEEEGVRTRRLVPLLKERAEIERLAFDYDAAKATLNEVIRRSPDDVEAWIELGDLWMTTGGLDDATKAYRIAEQAADRTGGGYKLLVINNKVGDVLMRQGDGAGALAAYRAGLAIAENVMHRDPQEKMWQRNVSVSHNKIGDVLMEQGDRAGALAAYRAGLVIIENLTQSDPANKEWQRDLSISQDRVGNVLAAQGDQAGALGAYRAGLAIRQALARGDPANSEWQRDLAVSQNGIGDALVAQGDRVGALASYRVALSIVEALAGRDPAHTEWQRDLSVSHNKVAEMLRTQGDGHGALVGFREGLAIMEALARRDPGNRQWQRDLSVSYDRIGDTLHAQGDSEGALAAHRAGLTIAEALARLDPANTAWQRDLVVSYVKISEMEPQEARASLTRAQEIVRGLKAAGRLAPVDDWMSDNIAKRLAVLPVFNERYSKE